VTKTQNQPTLPSLMWMWMNAGIEPGPAAYAAWWPACERPPHWPREAHSC